jgi:2-pyrone-4,6-dicarboxylate lactonase
VFGPAHLFPYPADAAFAPPDVPAQQVLALHERLGFERAVVVQSSAHGTDHRALLDLLERAGGRYRGVALVAPGAAAGDLAALDAAGIRGARLHFAPHLGADPDAARIRRVADLVRGLGWHLELHLTGTGVVDLETRIAGLDVPVVIDHMARFDLAEGAGGPAVSALRRLLDTGRVWVKVSGVDRLSRTGPPYSDAVALAALLVAHAPERTLWGTDFPHVNIVGDPPDDALLVDLIEVIAPGRRERERLLVQNPAEFFGFE